MHTHPHTHAILIKIKEIFHNHDVCYIYALTNINQCTQWVCRLKNSLRTHGLNIPSTHTHQHDAIQSKLFWYRSVMPTIVNQLWNINKNKFLENKQKRKKKIIQGIRNNKSENIHTPMHTYIQEYVYK